MPNNKKLTKEEIEELSFETICIPKNIFFDNNLTILDVHILMTIHYLCQNKNKECFASNSYLSKICRCAESKVTKSISNLIKLGYVEKVSFDGRIRKLKSNLEIKGIMK